MSIDISVVIPAFNEEQRIAATLRALEPALARRGQTCEILVVDDGSYDGTVALVEHIARGMPGLRCIATGKNRGKGHAVRVGMLAAQGRVRMMFDADGSMPADELARLLDPVLAGACDVAIGSRYVRGARTETPQPLWRRAWSRLANAAVRRSLGLDIADTQCGFKVFSAGAAAELFGRATIDGWAFDLEVLALAARLGYTVHELPIVWRDDDRSRVNAVSDFFAVVREWRRIRAGLRAGSYGRLGAPEPSASLSFPNVA